MRYTERRPDVYESRQEIFGNCQTVLDIIDKPAQDGDNEVLPFGQKQPGDIRKINWLWRCKGRLKIIATEFHEGVHYATRPEHLLKIVAHLKAIHEAGFVHGDIRAFNMVLNYEDENQLIGKLIDFDYGGKLSTKPKYPSGYVDELGDGTRLGKSGADITTSHDWYALGFIILNLYDLEHEDFDPVKLVINDQPLTDVEKSTMDCKALLSNYRDVFNEMNGDYAQIQNDPGKYLKKYLDVAKENKFKLDLSDTFRNSLRKCNMLEDGKPISRIDSKGATGSPKKSKN